MLLHFKTSTVNKIYINKEINKSTLIAKLNKSFNLKLNSHNIQLSEKINKFKVYTISIVNYIILEGYEPFNFDVRLEVKPKNIKEKKNEPKKIL